MKHENPLLFVKDYSKLNYLNKFSAMLKILFAANTYQLLRKVITNSSEILKSSRNDVPEHCT